MKFPESHGEKHDDEAELSDDAGGATQVGKLSQEDADGVCRQLAQEFV